MNIHEYSEYLDYFFDTLQKTENASLGTALYWTMVLWHGKARSRLQTLLPRWKPSILQAAKLGNLQYFCTTYYTPCTPETTSQLLFVVTTWGLSNLLTTLLSTRGVSISTTDTTTFVHWLRTTWSLWNMCRRKHRPLICLPSLWGIKHSHLHLVYLASRECRQMRLSQV